MVKRVVACVTTLVPELFQTFPELTLELENGEKRWIVLFQSPDLVLERSGCGRDSGKLWEILEFGVL